MFVWIECNLFGCSSRYLDRSGFFDYFDQMDIEHTQWYWVVPSYKTLKGYQWLSWHIRTFSVCIKNSTQFYVNSDHQSVLLSSSLSHFKSGSRLSLSTEMTKFQIVIVCTKPSHFIRSHASSFTSLFFFISFSTCFFHVCFSICYIISNC